MKKFFKFGFAVLIMSVSCASFAGENDSASENKTTQTYQAAPALDKEDKFSMLNLLRVPVSKTFTDPLGNSMEICYDNETYEKLDCSKL